MGSDPIALPLLDALLEGNPAGFELESVFTQPDRPSGRGMHLRPNAVKQWALEHGLPVHQPLKCGPQEVEYLARKAIDHVLVMAYGQILPKSFLEKPPLGVLNLHASLLPRLRGPSPIHTAVALGLAETGISLMRIIPKLDAGPVCDRETIPVGPEDTSLTVHDKLARASVPLVERGLRGLAGATLRFVEQDETEVTYCRIIDKEDCHLDFNAPARGLANRVRAFQPWPGTRFPFHDTEIRVLEAGAVEEGVSPGPPGHFFISTGGRACIACGVGALHLITLQRPGGRPMAADDFLRGFSIPEGSLLESREMRPLESGRPFPFRRQ